MGRRVALAIIAMPAIVRTTEDMLRIVPGSLREAGAALGAPMSKVITNITWRAVRRAAAAPVYRADDGPETRGDPAGRARFGARSHLDRQDRGSHRAVASEFTIAIVTHNMQQAARISQFTAFMYLGELVEFGPTNKIFMNPSKKQTQDYINGRFG
jgi:hypothetical protein